MTASLREIARMLGGEVSGSQEINCPGPGHSRVDRSLSVKLSSTAPDGFTVWSRCGDDWRTCKDYVREKLGVGRGFADERVLKFPVRREPAPYRDGKDERAIAAMNIWNGATGPIGTPVQVYLASRGLDLGEDLAGEVLRWSPRIRTMVALFRNIESGEPQAVSCTFLNAQAQKIERKFRGPVAGAAIMLDPFDSVTTGLFISEGVESAMAARQISLRPTWALGSAGAIGRFPPLNGIGTLSILRENDAANETAADSCAERWLGAGREVRDIWPKRGNDINDALLEGRK